MGSLDLRPSPGGDGTALAAMFAAHKQVFVDLLGWELPVSEERFEVDQFDDARAQYVLLDGAGMAHRGSARLLSTEEPNLLGDPFPSLCAGSVPSGADVWGITRFCKDRRLSRQDRREVRNELVSALARHAADTSIKTCTAVAGLAWFR